MEDLNEELIEINEASTEKLKETKEIPSEERNTKKDIIDKIYRLTEEYNIECQNTEKQFLRWSRKRLLKYLAETIEPRKNLERLTSFQVGGQGGSNGFTNPLLGSP